MARCNGKTKNEQWADCVNIHPMFRMAWELKVFLDWETMKSNKGTTNFTVKVENSTHLNRFFSRPLHFCFQWKHLRCSAQSKNACRCPHAPKILSTCNETMTIVSDSKQWQKCRIQTTVILVFHWENFTELGHIFFVLQAVDRAYTHPFMEWERWSLCGIFWVLLRQNTTGAQVLKHDCIYSQAFKREMLTRLYLSAFQGPETRWKKWIKIFLKNLLGPSPVFNKEKHLLCSQ